MTTSATPDLSALKAALAHLELSDNPRVVRAKSRDFFWYSPVLKQRMDHLSADFVIAPRSESELIEILRLCHQHDCPVSVRGAGTGNYGQIIPLQGGAVLDMRHFNAVTHIGPGRVVAQAGCILKDIDTACATSGQELRMFPSTRSQATVGGFVAGGSGGIGSVRWGMLRDLGNVLRLRVVTMEASPRVMDLTGADMDQVIHAYGTNGVITEVELPLAPAYDWVDVIVSFDDFARAAVFADEIAQEDGVLIKLASVIAAPIPNTYFPRLAGRIPTNHSMVALMVAPHAMPAFLTFMRRHPGQIVWLSD
ncbi:MAG: FAD-binding oxidoreductase, partial [Gemmobacter sp.]|nr:FAD-binding oxidoreductase [Gemmobacter sp.]